MAGKTIIVREISLNFLKKKKFDYLLPTEILPDQYPFFITNRDL